MEKVGSPGIWGTDSVSYLRSVFRDYEIRISAADGLTEPITMQGGLPQGHVLSPFLFNLYLDDLLKQLDGIGQAGGGDGSVRVLAYADDVVILCEDAADLQARLDTLHRPVSQRGSRAYANGATQRLKVGTCPRCTSMLRA